MTVLLVTCSFALVAATAASAKSTIRWHGCGRELPRNLQCGEVSVPLDYAHPRGATIRLGFARLPASDRARRIGSLIVNPGGPGGAGSEVVALQAIGRDLWHPALRQRFDLIGMDPRGIGLSTRVRCDPRVYNRQASLVPRSATEFRRLRAWTRALGKSCLRRTGPLLGHVDTESVARDMEALRRALGDGKLNFLGLSYGAEIGTLYAERYPNQIRTMALDGVLDHSLPTNAVFADSARGYEDALTRFAAWCAQDTGCTLHGRDVLALYDQLVQRANAQPIPAPACSGQPCRSPVTGSEIQLAAYNLLLFREPVPAIGEAGWNGLAEALAQADAGDASAFAAGRATAASGGPFPGLAVTCIDYPRLIRSYSDLVATSLLARTIAPHTQGYSEAWPGLIGCMNWPVPLQNPPHRARVRGAPSILLVNSTHDPSTPYVWAQNVRSQIPGAVLLTRDGDGHTSSLLPQSRTRDAIAAYLITRKRPPPNTVYTD